MERKKNLENKNKGCTFASIFRLNVQSTQRQVETEQKMPRTKEQNEAIRSERRQLILSAALKLFAEKGYSATSIDQIAQAASISKGLLYNYFKSKEELLQTIVIDLFVEFENAIDPNHDGTVTDDEAMGFIDDMFGILMNRKQEMQLYYQMMMQPQVVNIISHLTARFNLASRQHFILQYFVEKLPCADEKVAFLTVIAFLKGLFMVCVFAPEMFPNDFLAHYKEQIKNLLAKTIQNSL
jgi:AcrR family transcriptional regulator